MSDTTELDTSKWPHWVAMHNAKKFHLFLGGRSLCGKWGYFGNLNEGPWTGRTIREDCSACAKSAAKSFPCQKKED